MGGQHVPTLGLAAEVVPIEVRPAAFPINLLSYGAQSMALSYSFTFQLVSACCHCLLLSVAFCLCKTLAAPTCWPGRRW